MKNLYIIGNGFDIAHGISSRYEDYKMWLEEKQQEIYNKMANFFPDIDNENMKWWSDFENNLDTVSTHEVIYSIAAEFYQDLGSDDFRDSDYDRTSYKISKEIKDLYEEIQETLELWILQLNGPKTIFRFQLPKDTFYLTFNYTDTLQDYYGIQSENILHIHGRAIAGETLIFGHSGNENHIMTGTGINKPKRAKTLSLYEYQNWDDNIDDFIVSSIREDAISSIYEFQKPTHELITKYNDFFNQCKQIETLTILGLSFSKVDYPYLYTIFNVIDNNKAKCVIYYFSEEDLKNINSFLCEFKILSDNIQILHTSNHPHIEYTAPLIPHIFDHENKKEQ